MSEKELIKQLKRLPSEAQQEAADFVEFLSQKYLQQSEESGSSRKKSILENPFRGMWKDREDLQDSPERKARRRWQPFNKRDTHGNDVCSLADSHSRAYRSNQQH